MKNIKRKFLWRQVFTYAVIAVVVYGGIYYYQSNQEESRANQSNAQNVTQQPVELVPTYGQNSPVVIPTTNSRMNIYLSRTDSVKGKYMTDFEGMTLYTFDKDAAGISNCTESCEKIWPPYITDTSAQTIYPSNISLFQRKNGSMQYAWKEMPLYRYATDKKVGEINGDGVGGLWHIIKL